MPSPFPCSLVIREWLWKKSQIENKYIMKGTVSVSSLFGHLYWMQQEDECCSLTAEILNTTSEMISTICLAKYWIELLDFNENAVLYFTTT